MNVPPFTAGEILAQLDECARAFTFPMLDNGYVYPADVRLTAFRDNTRWALVIECVGAHPRAGGHDSIYDCLHCFGNCLRRVPGTANEDFLGRTSDGDDGPIFDDEYDWYVNEGVRNIRIRDTLVALHLGPETLAKKGIFLEDPPRINGAELLRSLLPEYRDLFLATDAELRERIPADLPAVLRLDEWHHPDLAADELPSQSATFQMIAEVLVSGDPSRYVPTREANTHWSNWPGGGKL